MKFLVPFEYLIHWRDPNGFPRKTAAESKMALTPKDLQDIVGGAVTKTEAFFI